MNKKIKESIKIAKEKLKKADRIALREYPIQQGYCRERDYPEELKYFMNYFKDRGYSIRICAENRQWVDMWFEIEKPKAIDMYKRVVKASETFESYKNKPYNSYYMFYDDIIKETDKAVLFSINDENYWIPKSVIIDYKKSVKKKVGLDGNSKIIKQKCKRVRMKNNFFTATQLEVPYLITALGIHGDKAKGSEGYYDIGDGQDYSACGTSLSDIIPQEF